MRNLESIGVLVQNFNMCTVFGIFSADDQNMR